MNKVIVNIDSKFRNRNLYKNSGKFSIKVDCEIKNVKKIKMSTVEFVNLYYTKVKNNVSFKVTTNSTIYDIVLDDSFFIDVGHLMYALQNKLDTVLPITHAITLQMDYVSGILIFEGLEHFSLDFESDTLYKSMGEQLGFNNNVYVSDSDKKIKNDTIVVLSNDRYIYIKVNNYGNLYTLIKSNYDNDLKLNKYLAKVALFMGKTEVGETTTSLLLKEYEFKDPINISKFDIELIDPHGVTIEMYNNDYSFTLELDCETFC